MAVKPLSNPEVLVFDDSTGDEDHPHVLVSVWLAKHGVLGELRRILSELTEGGLPKVPVAVTVNYADHFEIVTWDPDGSLVTHIRSKHDRRTWAELLGDKI